MLHQHVYSIEFIYVLEISFHLKVSGDDHFTVVSAKGLHLNPTPPQFFHPAVGIFPNSSSKPLN
ncbi:unnamed protein product [Mycena citricolor]|uniref:Uncharacterized protein n=1 Tax=Mycena citricolor TaxID=2018698 RepID=A0AAD2GQF1_9AGAR|nr:unnamed protein product [Mycena citricolor]